MTAVAAAELAGLGVHVPFLIVVLSLPVHVATATSHFVLSISSSRWLWSVCG